MAFLGVILFDLDKFCMEDSWLGGIRDYLYDYGVNCLHWESGAQENCRHESMWVRMSLLANNW